MYADTNKEMDIIGTVNEIFYHEKCAPPGSQWKPHTEYNPSGSACGECIKTRYDHRFIAVIAQPNPVLQHFI